MAFINNLETAARFGTLVPFILFIVIYYYHSNWHTSPNTIIINDVIIKRIYLIWEEEVETA